MKKVGIRLLLSLILLTALVVTASAPVSAAKPVKLRIIIHCITEGSIFVNYGWNKIGAHYYEISVYEVGGAVLNTTGRIPLGGRTPKKSGYLTLTSPNITCGHQYGAEISLYKRAEREIHGATVYAEASFDCPPPSIFAEDFCGVPEGSLPENWFTNNSSLVYVWNFGDAGGQRPEVYMDYGWEEYKTHNYYVRTPAIDATAMTTLNLTFKHYLDIYGWGNNFTYSVEVSYDNVNWMTVFEETPTEALYPGPNPEIGPETLSYNLTAYAGNNIYIRWRLRGYAFWSNGWRIDDVTVTGS